jgi:hypothetical protein
MASSGAHESPISICSTTVNSKSLRHQSPEAAPLLSISENDGAPVRIKLRTPTLLKFHYNLSSIGSRFAISAGLAAKLSWFSAAIRAATGPSGRRSWLPALPECVGAQSYPAALALAGLTDPRVLYWELA